MVSLSVNMRAIILLVFVAVAIAASQHSRIVRGNEADIEKYPFLANLQFTWFHVVYQVTCGGTIITIKTILTTASCIHGFNSPAHWKIRLGSSYPDTGGEVHNVERFILHHAYNNHINDVAIVRLPQTLTLSSSIGVARLAGPRYNLPVDTNVTIVGWGRLIWGGEYAEQLQEAEIQVFDHETCKERYAFLSTVPGYTHYPEVTSDMVCVFGPGTWSGPCNGDFGGPLLYDGDIVFGLTSWAFGCGDFWYPTVNVKVSSYVHWILAYGSF